MEGALRIGRSCRRLLLLPACALGLTLAQPNVVRGQPDPVTPDVELQLEAAGGQSVFRIGEVIPLDLLFTSTTPDRYRLYKGKPGRGSHDRFRIRPATGWSDPQDGMTAFMGGGLGAIPMLSREPTVLRLHLNDWVRFDDAGTYRVQVESERVLDLGPPSRSVHAVSNEVTIEIVEPTREWRSETLAAALDVLDGPAFSMTGPEWRESPGRDAVRTLVHLGTPEAASAMARRLRGERDWDQELSIGLFASPHRAEAIAEMEQQLAAPDFPVSAYFVFTLAELTASGTSEKGVARDRLWKQVAGLLDTKQGAARTAAAASLATQTPETGAALSTSETQQVGRALVEDFDSLSIQERWRVVRQRSLDIDEELLIPLLEKVARGGNAPSGPRTSDDAWWLHEARAEAFQRWYALAPEAARLAMLEEIVRPRPEFDATVLGVLADETLPEMDAALASNLLQARDSSTLERVASLVERYATGDLEPTVLTVLGRDLGERACEIETSLIGFLLRVDPVSAPPHLATFLADRGPRATSCSYQPRLSRLGELWNDPVLEAFALERLEDGNPRVVDDAARYLQRFGGPSAREALWACYTAWSARWKGRERRYRSRDDELLAAEALAGANLLRALALGQGWVLDESDLLELKRLAVGPEQQESLDEYLEAWRPAPPFLYCYSGNPPRIGVLHYEDLSLEEARAKVSQLRAGTLLRWRASGTNPEVEDGIFRELSTLASRHGVTIERSPED